MSFFPRSFVTQDANPSSFHPLFRLLDDFDQYNRNPENGSNNNGNDGNNKRHQTRSIMKSFTPKFDVKEIGDVYELHGELPGIDQKDVSIEFTDAETLVIKGRTERSYTSSNKTSGALEGSSSTKTIDSSSHKDKEHQPKVEDEEPNNNTTVATTTNNSVSTQPKEPEAKYWVSERSVGEFSRSFTFPVRVDQEQVKASMKNGVLSVIVPKAKKTEARKIAIE